jgi:hypothetical protein
MRVLIHTRRKTQATQDQWLGDCGASASAFAAQVRDLARHPDSKRGDEDNRSARQTARPASAFNVGKKVGTESVGS